MTSEIVVKLGKYDLSVKHERGSATRYPSDIILHPQWDTLSQIYDADIAVIILETKTEINNSIVPICLWQDGTKEPKKDTRGTVVGWGKSEFETAHENKPRELELTVSQNEECFTKNLNFAEISSNRTFCAGKDSYSGPCKGDSGSGMFMRLDTERWFLKGIVSAGFTIQQSCDVSVDTLFTDVIKYTDWIYKVTDEHNVVIPAKSQETNQTEKLIQGQSFDEEIFCFFESWSDSRQGDGEFTLNHLEPQLCTTLVFLQAELDDDGLAPNNPWQQTDENGQELYKNVNELKKKHKLRTLLSVGSWNDEFSKFSNLSANPERRQFFARSSADFLMFHKFDGLHFNSDYPAYGKDDGKENFVLLLKEIRDVYEMRNLYLSVFVRTENESIERGYDLKNIVKYVDKLLMMTFDFFGNCHGKIEFPAPLKSQNEHSMQSRVDYFIAQGVSSDKILVGVPFYGRIFGSTDESEIGAVANAGPFGGPFSNDPGFIGYNEICHYSKKYVNEKSFDVESSQAIMRMKGGDISITILYDSPRSIVHKAKFLKDKNLGGAWIVYTNSDDFRSECDIDTEAFLDFSDVKVSAREQKDFPLLRTLHKAMEIFSSGNQSLS